MFPKCVLQDWSVNSVELDEAIINILLEKAGARELETDIEFKAKRKFILNQETAVLWKDKLSASQQVQKSRMLKKQQKLKTLKLPRLTCVSLKKVQRNGNGSETRTTYFYVSSRVTGGASQI